ncbi:MAG: transposase family protein [Verrucomicrobiota bacterium]
MSVPPSPSLPNQKCPYQTEAEERTARLEVVTGQMQAYGSTLPGLLKRLSQIADPRQPRKTRHQLTVLMIYGILGFVFQMSSRREANRKMPRPVVKLVPLASSRARLTRHPDLIGSTVTHDPAALVQPLPPEEWGELAGR